MERDRQPSAKSRANGELLDSPAAKPSHLPANSKAEGFPTFYSRWLEALLDAPLPVEHEATCPACAMCPPPGEKAGDDRFFFNSDCKCCTYSPGLPNFLVGAILADSSPSMATGRTVLKRRLGENSGTSPLVILPPPTYNLLYRHSPNAFGRSRGLRCPYFDDTGGTCTIWPYREPTCITWFCKHERGKIGKDFWESLHTLLTAINKELALWCVLQLNIGPDALKALENWRKKEISGENLQPNEVDNRKDTEAAKIIWGHWWGREAAFYAECSRLVAALDWQDIAKICGTEVQLATRMITEAHLKLLAKDIPTHLKLGRFEVEGASSEGVRVWTYSRLDPIELPVSVFNALPYFNGRSTADILSEVRLHLGVHLDSQLLQTLVDFGILQNDRR